MEPVTHLLTGACLARAGCNRKAAYATAAMVIAAELPDIDTVWSLRGPVEGFAHHRGITHTFLGLPFEAAALVGGIFLVHRWRAKRYAARLASFQGDGQTAIRPLNRAPVRWSALYGFVLLALLSHLLLDYTNNYGVRPLFPFLGHWFAGSFVFIFDPLIFGLLVAGLVLPYLFGLVSSEVGARQQAFRGRGLAIAALLCVSAIWGLRWFEHGKALEIAMSQSYGYAPATPGVADASAESGDTSKPLEEKPVVYLQPQAALANPDPLNPFHWSVVIDFGVLYQLAEVDTRREIVTPAQTTYPKPSCAPAVPTAMATKLGKAYMDWSPMPIVTMDRSGGDDAVPPSGTVVLFRDPRFMGGIDWLHMGGRTPLRGTVTLDAQGRVVEQAMDGRVER